MLGPRQCGKTTLVEHQIKPDISISFLISHLRRRYEQSPDLLISEIEAQAKICYWRDHNGPEVDYVIIKDQQLVPIEVKWTEIPSNTDIKHLLYFMEIYNIKQGYIICRTPRRMLLNESIIALPWNEISEIIDQL